MVSSGRDYLYYREFSLYNGPYLPWNTVDPNLGWEKSSSGLGLLIKRIIITPLPGAGNLPMRLVHGILRFSYQITQHK